MSQGSGRLESGIGVRVKKGTTNTVRGSVLVAPMYLTLCTNNQPIALITSCQVSLARLPRRRAKPEDNNSYVHTGPKTAGSTPQGEPLFVNGTRAPGRLPPLTPATWSAIPIALVSSNCTLAALLSLVPLHLEIPLFSCRAFELAGVLLTSCDRGKSSNHGTRGKRLLRGQRDLLRTCMGEEIFCRFIGHLD